MEEQVIVGLSNEVLAKLDALAHKIGVTVEQVWPWLIKQQYIEAIYPLVLFGFFSIASIPVYRFIKRIRWDKGHITLDQIIGCVLVFGVGVGIIVSLVGSISEFNDIFNPEYWALKDLMRMIN